MRFRQPAEEDFKRREIILVASESGVGEFPALGLYTGTRTHFDSHIQPHQQHAKRSCSVCLYKTASFYIL